MDKVIKSDIYWRHRAIILKHLNNTEGKRYTADDLAKILYLGQGGSSNRYIRELISDIGLKYPVLSNSSRSGYRIANSSFDLEWALKQKEENLSRIKRLYAKNRPLDNFIKKMAGEDNA